MHNFNGAAVRREYSFFKNYIHCHVEHSRKQIVRKVLKMQAQQIISGK
jgi:hypothetical protein